MAYTRQWLVEDCPIVPWQKAFVVVFLAALSAGCVDLRQSISAGSPTVVAITVAPATPTPMATATSAPSITPARASPTTPTIPQNEEWLERAYSWEYKAVQWNFNVKISKTIYEFYRNSPRARPNYAAYAMTAEDREFLRDITAKLEDNGKANGYTGLDDVRNVIALVQSIDYEEDTGGEYTRYPLETLADEKGDCKDKSILGAAMLHEMGYNVVLLKFLDHMALGIKSGGGMEGTYYEYGGSRYYYVEMTGPNWDIGDIPDELTGQVPTIYMMEESPVIEATLEVKPAGASGYDSSYNVSVSLKNKGPGMASNLSAHVYALALERGSGKMWAPDRIIHIGDYGEGQAGNIVTDLTVFSGEKTQIYCVITGDNVDTLELKTSTFYG